MAALSGQAHKWEGAHEPNHIIYSLTDVFIIKLQKRVFLKVDEHLPSLIILELKYIAEVCFLAAGSPSRSLLYSVLHLRAAITGYLKF